MANLKKIKSESLATIDAALAILNNFPELDEGDMSLSVNTSANPFPYLMETFKKTTGFDILLKILSTFLAAELPALELAVKGVLLSNIKNLLTCSLNPFISDEILREGVIFSINQIDITDTLRYSPLDTERGGKYYYFGCDDCQTADDVRDTAYYNTRVSSKSLSDVFYGTRDMNALIWFMRNRASRREVWGKKASRDDNEYKPEKKYGIVTFEYGARPQSLKYAEGGQISTQTPGYDLLHVFIGNTQEEECDLINGYENTISDANEKLMQLKDLEEQLNERIQQQKELISNVESRMASATNIKIEDNSFVFPQNLIEKDLISKHNDNLAILNKLLDNENKIYSAEDIAKKVEKNITSIQTFLDTTNNTIFYESPSNIDSIIGVTHMIQKISEIKTTAQSEYSSNISQLSYRGIKENYYYHRTLFEFNYDFVMSLKLFDEKVITAQLINQLCGLGSVNFEMSYKQSVMREEIKKMVSSIIETDDAVVNDCFFTFSNADYDAMLNKAEMQKAGLFTINGEQNTTARIDGDALLNQLNGLSEDASKETVQAIIEGALTTISGEVSTYQYGESEQINFGAQMNFIENLMNNLAYVIVGSVLSPKVYLLILINLKLLGENNDFDLDEFIGKFKGLIISILREIRDRLIEYLMKELMKVLGNIAKDVAVKISLEQAYYNMRLIKRLIACIKAHKGQGLDFNIDEAVVDIYDTENEPTSDEC